jgi:regulation of enolase protein 1 (concanavalin A-like superfamily)/two-component sensor histidine kinase/DNA-binding response OmpR family regulator
MREQKIWGIDNPPVVAVLGTEAQTGELVEELDAEGGYRIEHLSDPETALDRLDRRPAVDCLWIEQGSDGGDSEAFVREVVDRDDEGSIVFAATDGSEALAAAVTSAGATEYVHSGATLADHVETVQTAVDRGISRRYDAFKRSALDSMLTEFNIAMYGKDRQARHVIYADVPGSRDPEEVFGKTDAEAHSYTKEEAEETMADDMTVIEDHKRIRCRSESFEGSSDGLEAWKVPWTKDGETQGLVGLTYDVNHLKKRESELLRQIARLQQIPDYVNHDLKNQLSIAEGYLELTEVEKDEALETVGKALDRMGELLDDFHSLATQDLDTDTGGEERPLLLADLIEDLWEYVATDESILDIAIEPGTWLTADESQVRPLLKNLLGNAIDHAGPDVTVRVGTTENGFYIEDDGPGIPPDERDQVFEQGYTTSTEGTGLGLAIVNESARLHEWDISVTEGDLGGARFVVDGCLIGTPLPGEQAGEPFQPTESVDIGDVEVDGSATGSDGSYEVTGAGRNIWNYVNQFHFLQTPVEGDVRIQGRVTDIEVVSDYSKAGLMIRSSLKEDAAYGFLANIADEMAEVDWRQEEGTGGRNFPVGGLGSEYDWFRVDRLGDQITCSISADGDHWEFIDRRAVELEEPIHVGLAVCSVSQSVPITAHFEDVTIRPLSPTDPE